MKKIAAALLIAALIGSLLSGCGIKEKISKVIGSAGQNLQDTESENDQYSLETLKSMPKFSVKDTEGNTVTNDVFQDYDLTLINLWGTWCSPCIKELPDLQKASEALKSKNIQVIGVCEDADSELDFAKKIMKENGVTYRNLVPNAEFRDDFISLCQAFPSNIVVDSKGRVVKNVFSGSQDSDTFVATLEELLEQNGSGGGDEKNSAKQKAPGDPAQANTLDDFYSAYKALMKKGVEEYGMDSGKILKNLDILKTYQQKAMKYCGDEYAETSRITDKNGKEILSKLFYSKGSYRKEEYHGGKIRYVEVYNQKKNTYDFYDVEKDQLQTITNASQKGYRKAGVIFGFFPVLGYNGALGDIKEDTLAGKKVLYCEYNSDFTNKIWIDQETGIMIKAQQITGDKVDYQEVTDLKTDVNLDDSLFIFKKDNPDPGKAL